jgi:hypothetical protein
LRNITCAAVDVMLMLGVSRTLLVTQLGSLWNAAFGAVSTGAVFVVVQLLPSVHNAPPTVQSPSPFVNDVVQPAGSAGAAMPSKFSVKAMFATPREKV